MRCVSSLLALACLACGGPALAQFGPPPSEVIPPQLATTPQIPSDQQLQAMHARIGRVEIHVIQVFDLANPSDNNWLYRIADELHVPTRPSVVRALLLFHTGDLYSPALLQESARYIRESVGYLREPVIRPVAYHDGRVDIEVITHDVWTLQPGVSFSRAGGANAYGFSFSDENFLGTGKYVMLGHTETVDRSSSFVQWNDPNVAGTHWNDSVLYANNSDGTVWGVAGGLPFYSLEAPYAFGVDVGNDHSVIPRYRLGLSYDYYDNDWRTADLYVGDSLVVSSRWTERLMLGWRVDESSFGAAPRRPLLAPLPADRDLSYPFVRMHWVRNRFVTMDNLALIARTEDVHLGIDAAVGMGFAAPFFAADRYAVLLDTEVSDAFAFSRSQQLFLQGRMATRVEHGELHDASITGSASYYLATSDDTRFYANVTTDIGHNLDGDHYFDLGGDNGLRGYPLRYQNGNQLALFTAEERLYTNWFPFRLFNVGAAAFFDMGRTWGSPLVPTPQLGLLKDVGVGLRLGNARSSFGSVIHVDLAMPLDRGYGISRMQFLVTTQQSY